MRRAIKINHNSYVRANRRANQSVVLVAAPEESQIAGRTNLFSRRADVEMLRGPLAAND